MLTKPATLSRLHLLVRHPSTVLMCSAHVLAGIRFSNCGKARRRFVGSNPVPAGHPLTASAEKEVRRAAPKMRPLHRARR
jgi:hypothetical protein